MKKAKRKRVPRDAYKAYWIGVGMSTAIHNGFKTMDDMSSNNRPDLRRSLEKGYEADNHADLSKNFYR